MVNTGKDLTGYLYYRSDLFSHHRMVEFVKQFELLLSQIVSHPESSIDSYSLLTPEAKNILPDPFHVLERNWYGSLHQRFIQQSQRVPNNLAICNRDGSWTYIELNNRSNQLAHYLQKNGIRKGDAVAIYGERDPSLIVAVLGILKVGAAFIILDSNHPASRLEHCLRLTEPKGWIQLKVAGSPADSLKGLLASLNISCSLELPSGAFPTDGDPLREYPQTDICENVEPDNLSYITFTSGTTDIPNAIEGTHRPLSHFFDWYCQTFKFQESERFGMVSGLSHDPLLRDIFTPLCLGATLCIPQPHEILSMDLAHWLSVFKISIVHTTPAIARLVTEQASEWDTEGDNVSSLRYVFFGGDILTNDDCSAFRKLVPKATLINVYGATETPQAMGYFISDAQFDPSSRNDALGRDELIPLGRVFEMFNY